METTPGPEDSSLKALLTSFREAGRVDSHGVFTLAGCKAAGKLATHLLPEPSDWILKVVQSACGAGASELKIQQANRATHLEFRLPYLADLRALEGALTQGLTPSQPGLDDLCIALRSLGLGQGRAWVARLRTEETTHWVMVREGEVSLETSYAEPGPRGETDILLGVAYPPGEIGKMAGLVRFGAAVQNEHEALAQRAMACPIPLWLDGERVDTLRRPKELGGFEEELFLTVASGQTAQPQDLPSLGWPQGLQESSVSGMRDRLFDPRPYHLPEPPPKLRGSSLLRVAFRFHKESHLRRGRHYSFRPLATPSRVHLVHHGVLVGRRNLGITEAVAVDIYLPADPERVTLSGLEQDVPLEAVAQARAELPALLGCWTPLVNRLSEHRPLWGGPQWLAGGAVAGLAVALAPWPLKLVGAGAAIAQWRWSVGSATGLVEDCMLELQHFRRQHLGSP